MIRLATIGTSVITDTFLEAAAGRLDVVACHSRDAQRGARLAERHHVPEVVTDLDALLARNDLDAVYVASPNAVHAGQVQTALEAGKHVLVEKPLTASAADTERLVDLAHDRGLVLLEAMRSAFDPGMRVLRDLLPEVGRVRRVSFRYVQRSARYDKVLAGEPVAIFDPAMGGGALLDLGVYCARPLVDLFGAPEHVLAASAQVTTGADGATVVVATYPGIVADLSCSKITASEAPSEIQGELATLTIDHIAAPRRLVVELHTGERHETVVDGGGDNHLVHEVVRFVELVEAGLLPEQESEASIRTARLVDAARAVAVVV